MTKQQATGPTTERADAGGPRGRPGVLGRPTPGWAVPLVAVVVAAVVWTVSWAAGAELVVRTGAGTRTVGLVDVVVAALVVGCAGWGVRAVLRRLPGGGSIVWTVLCVVVLLVSLVGVFGAATPAALGFLVAQHAAVGAAVALGLRR